MKTLRVKKKWVEDYNTAKAHIEELDILYEFYKEGEYTIEDVNNQYNKTATFLEDIEFKNMLSEEGDSLSAVLQITAGAGGTESCDWASMLMRMYLMFAEKSGFKVKELNYQEGDTAGIKTVTIEIDLGNPQKIEGLLLQEYIPFGQRVASFQIECYDGKEWLKITEQQTIGYKKLIMGKTPETNGKEFPLSSRIRLIIKDSRGSPVINTFSVIGV